MWPALRKCPRGHLYQCNGIYLSSWQTGGYHVIIVICMFWDNKHLWAFMLDSLESLSMLCAKVLQPCPVPDRLCRQTWKNITRYLTSIARFMEKNINVEWEKMRLDFPSETGIKCETGRGIFLFEWSCCQARAELNQLERLVQSELSIASSLAMSRFVVKTSRWTGGDCWINVLGVEFVPA